MSVIIYQNPQNSELHKKSSSKHKKNPTKEYENFIPNADSDFVTREEAKLILNYMIENYHWRHLKEEVEIADLMNLRHCDLACGLDYKVWPTTSTTIIQDVINQINDKMLIEEPSVREETFASPELL